MPDEDAAPRLTPAELRARLVGNALDRDEEDIRFWRQASEREQGEALYELLQFAQDVIDSTPKRPEEPLTFPGFSWKQNGTTNSQP
jgi:hypothetical protein